jgi:hypothetical protein
VETEEAIHAASSADDPDAHVEVVRLRPLDERADGLHDDEHRRDRDGASLGAARHELDLAVPVRVVLVGGLRREAHGEVHRERGDDVHDRLHRVGEDRGRVGQEPREVLRAEQRESHREREERGGEARVRGGRSLGHVGKLAAGSAAVKGASPVRRRDLDGTGHAQTAGET